MKVFVTFLFLIFLAPRVDAMIAGGIALLSAVATKAADVFASKGSVSLKKVTFSVDKNMNNNGAIRVHLVIVYNEPELINELKTMSASRYFERVDQLNKNYPEKMKIFEWEVCAKEDLFSYDPKYPTDKMTPEAVFVFASYSTSLSSIKEHRARVANRWEKIKITLRKDDFEVSPVEDQEPEDDEFKEKSQIQTVQENIREKSQTVQER